MTNNIIARSLSTMKDPNNYKEIDEGFFTNRPKIKGYLLELDGFMAKVYILVNTSKEDLYEKNIFSEEGYHFLIYNSDSLESFIEKLPEEASNIIKILTDIKNSGTETGKDLPYGYIEDEEGNIKVEPNEAGKVRKIFKNYINDRSIRKVAKTFKEDYSFVHDILHDARYSKMPIKIVPQIDIKKVNLIIQQNTKNKYRKNKLRRTF